jgi:hypothetical protein
MWIIDDFGRYIRAGRTAISQVESINAVVSPGPWCEGDLFLRDSAMTQGDRIDHPQKCARG